MRFRIYVWTQTGVVEQMGTGSNDFDAALLTQWGAAMKTTANHVYLLDMTNKTVTVLR